MWFQVVIALIVAVVAILMMVDFSGEETRPSDEQALLSSDIQEETHQVYVIGDLHGDVECAKHWVQRIGVVDNVEEPTKWLQPEASLVFMGDYIDKGPFSYQTMLFVKSLTDAFPERVIALMGNHEMEVLKDRHPLRQPKYFNMPYAVIHPGEFTNFVLERELDETDDIVVDLLLNATLQVYSQRLQRSVLFAPESSVEGRLCIIDFVEDQDKKHLVKERLTEYQHAYLSAFWSNTTLGKWVETLRVAHIQNGVLFVHGGVDRGIASVLSSFDSIDALNDKVANNAGNHRFWEFLQGTTTGRAIEKMLFYRGNHDGDCHELASILQDLGVDRLAVGHTPDENIRQLCGGQFLALDSLLGRWIRTSGNYYCPAQSRSRGNFACPNLEADCQGQVVKIGKDTVQIIRA
jgi:hypothetical protein